MSLITRDVLIEQRRRNLYLARAALRGALLRELAEKRGCSAQRCRQIVLSVLRRVSRARGVSLTNQKLWDEAGSLRLARANANYWLCGADALAVSYLHDTPKNVHYSAKDKARLFTACTHLALEPNT